MGKYTKSDIKRIAAAMKRQKGKPNRPPLALITGAGCSQSAGIPLAGEFAKLIIEKFPEDCASLSKEQKEHLDYGACMSVVDHNDIRDLFTPYLEGAKINWGHLAIAAMMKAGYIGRVLTFNFDSILARACGMLGIYPATYDFVSGVSARTDFIAEQAIIHLHGQGHGLAMLNKLDDTKEHAEQLRPLLLDIFTQHAVMVIGYSGDSDAVFKVIKDIAPQSGRLDWVGYDKESAKHVSELMKISGGPANFLGDADSDLFLMELAEELGCWMPELFENYYGHLLEQLDPVADFPKTKTDPLTDLRAELSKKRDSKASEPDKKLALFLKSDWEALVKAIGSSPQSERDKEFYGIAKASLASDLHTENPDNETFLKKALRNFEVAIQYIPESHVALNNWGNAQASLARLKQSSDFFKQSFATYKAALDIKPDKNQTLYNWGNAITGLAKLKKDPALFQQSIIKYKAALDIKPDDHLVLNNWGSALAELAKLKKDPDIFQQSIEKYKTVLDIKPDKHEALNNWGLALAGLARLKKDPEIFEQSIEKYKAALDIKPDNHEALSNWGNALFELAMLKQDSSIFEHSIEKYKTTIDIKPDNREVLSNWGVALAELAKLKKDPQIFEQSIEKYKAALDIKPDNHEALSNLGDTIMSLYKIFPKPQLMEEVEKVLTQAKKLKPNALYNLACLYALQNKPEDAKTALLHCETKGTLPSLEHLETDTDMDSLRGEDWFQDLLARVREKEAS